LNDCGLRALHASFYLSIGSLFFLPSQPLSCIPNLSNTRISVLPEFKELPVVFYDFSSPACLFVDLAPPATFAKLFGNFEMRDGFADRESHSGLSISVFS
jgi:hypothetical protein